jgi:hypothetical protein
VETADAQHRRKRGRARLAYRPEQQLHQASTLAGEYDLTLHEISQPTHDATTSDGRNVQIKATFKNSLTFRTVPDYYLGFVLFPDGRYEEVFNGPGRIIFDRYANRANIGKDLLSFPIKELRKLSVDVPEAQRIQKRRDSS